MTIDEMISRKKELGYSYKKLAELSGVPSVTIQKIFRKETKTPRYETLTALTRALQGETVVNEGYEELPYDELLSNTASYPGTNMVKEQEGIYITSGSSALQPDYETEQSNLSKKMSLQKKSQRIIGWTEEGTPIGPYTIRDIENLPEDVRAELIDGYIYFMGEPLRVHQTLVMELSFLIRKHIYDHKGACKVYPAPLGVRLEKDNKTLVEPDVVVVCDRDKLTRKGCNGAPEWVIEIVSPGNKKHDYFRKLELYGRAGVKEYWIVDPEKEQILVYLFGSRKKADVEDKVRFDTAEKDSSYATGKDNSYVAADQLEQIQNSPASYDAEKDAEEIDALWSAKDDSDVKQKAEDNMDFNLEVWNFKDQVLSHTLEGLVIDFAQIDLS